MDTTNLPEGSGYNGPTDEAAPLNALEARAELYTPPGAVEEVPRSVKFTYPDGCEVFGVPPFPEKSPLEVQAKTLRDESADLIAMQQAGAIKAAREEEAAKIAAAAANKQPSGIVTADQVAQSPDLLPDTPAA